MSIYYIQSDREAAAVAQSLRRRVVRAVGWLAFVIAALTLGFFIIDVLEKAPGEPPSALFDALWNTLNVVSTLGDLEHVTRLERAWAMLAIVVGLGAVLYGFSSLQALFHGDVARLMERRKMQKKLSQLEGHVIVCGYGRVGRGVAVEIRRQGRSAVVVEIDRRRADHADEDGFTVVCGDCTDEQTLRGVAIERAAGLIAALGADSANVYLILTARELAPRVRIVARAERSKTLSTLLRAGADRAVAPGELAAVQLSHLLLKPMVSEFIAAATGEGEFDFVEMPVLNHPNLLGRTLGDLDLPHRAEAVVIAVIADSGEQEFAPPPNRKLQANDTLLLVCREGGLERIAKI